MDTAQKEAFDRNYWRMLSPDRQADTFIQINCDVRTLDEENTRLKSEVEVYKALHQRAQTACAAYSVEHGLIVDSAKRIGDLNERLREENDFMRRAMNEDLVTIAGLRRLADGRGRGIRNLLALRKCDAVRYRRLEQMLEATVASWQTAFDRRSHTLTLALSMVNKRNREMKALREHNDRLEEDRNRLRAEKLCLQERLGALQMLTKQEEVAG